MVVNTETQNWTNFKESQRSIQLQMEPRYHIPKAEGPLQQRGLVEKFIRAEVEEDKSETVSSGHEHSATLGTHYILATCTRPAQDQCRQHSSMRWEQACILNWGPIGISQLLGEGVSVFYGYGSRKVDQSPVMVPHPGDYGQHKLESMSY